MSGPEPTPLSGRSRHNPRVIMTVGLYGSASTWVYNLARELLAARHGEARVHAVYSDTVSKVLEDRQTLGRYVVWKMHFGEPAFDVFAQFADPTMVLTVRDPRDAIVSLMNRFNTRLEVAVSGLARSCNRLVQCAAATHPVLRYEDGFFRDVEVARTIAAYIGAPVGDEAIRAIFNRYSTEAVRRFAQGVEALPAERVKGDPFVDLYDEVTQIHRGHIGDGSVGKWQWQLTAEQQQALTAHFAPFLARFGYT